MALVLQNNNGSPFGQFDMLDSQLSSIKGGEVATFTGVTPVAYGGTDLSAADVQEDGYAGTTTKVRPAITITLPTAANSGPFFLTDDGILHYGTLFGAVVGGTVGQQFNVPGSYTGAILGPSTALGSGKVTLWGNPGVYGVTLDNVDTTSTTGLVPTNSTITTGAPLYATPAGLLTPNVSAGTANGAAIIGRFLTFETTGSLVTTPNTLVSGFASPSGPLGGAAQAQMYMAVFTWKGSF
jgi:hypothetical protein